MDQFSVETATSICDAEAQKLARKAGVAFIKSNDNMLVFFTADAFDDNPEPRSIDQVKDDILAAFATAGIAVCDVSYISLWRNNH